jgi:hypothetical protein
MPAPEEELKPCPFCGKEATYEEDPPIYAISCDGCQFGLIEHEKKLVLNAWNSRSPREGEGETAFQFLRRVFSVPGTKTLEEDIPTLTIGTIMGLMEDFARRSLPPESEKMEEVMRKAFEAGVHASEMGIDYENGETVGGAFDYYFRHQKGEHKP